jgi:hypothetical protein
VTGRNASFKNLEAAPDYDLSPALSLLGSYAYTFGDNNATDGDGSGPRVFCIVEEVPSGTWSINGATWTSVFTAQTLGLDGRRIEAMEQALAARPRIDIPYVVRE